MTIRGLDLPEDVVEKITYGNFAAFAGEKPKPVCTDRFRSAAEKVYGCIREDRNTEVDWVKEILGS